MGKPAVSVPEPAELPILPLAKLGALAKGRMGDAPIIGGVSDRERFLQFWLGGTPVCGLNLALGRIGPWQGGCGMVDVRALTGDEIDAHIDDIAALRLAVFRDWPYLYHGTLDYERQYVASYRDHPGALLVAAFAEGRLIGASTSTPLEDLTAEFASPFFDRGIPRDHVLWGPESALLPAWRGQGIGHHFFALREAHARALGRTHVAFASILRPASHPARPEGARTNDAFWTRAGYATLPGVVVEFSWKDVGAEEDSVKPLQVWMKAL